MEKNTMKIAIIVREYHRKGGISKVVVEIAERMANLGYEVHIFTGNYDKIENTKVIFHKIPIIKGVVFNKLGLYKISKFLQGISFCIISKFYLKYDIFDIVHVNGDTLAKFDIRMAHSCHKAWLKLANKNLKGPFDWIKKNLNPHHWRILITEKFNFTKGNYKKIIAISEITKQEIIENYNVPFGDIVVVPLGVDLNKFNPEHKKLYRSEIRNKYNISEEEIVLLFVGYDFHRKGLEFVIKAISRLKNQDIKLLVVGRDKVWPYINLAKKINVIDKIIFVGAQNEINKFYSASDIFVFPTIYEPFGLVVIEAMASGLPVIVSKIAGSAEIITDSKDGMLIGDPKNVEEISEKLYFLIKNKELREEIGKNARITAENFSWDKITDRIINVYKEVLKNKNENLYSFKKHS
ncbi:MAG: glycosyltransferase family 4 protein [Endomicrobiia bacterium]